MYGTPLTSDENEAWHLGLRSLFLDARARIRDVFSSATVFRRPGPATGSLTTNDVCREHTARWVAQLARERAALLYEPSVDNIAVLRVLEAHDLPALKSVRRGSA